MKKWIGIIGMGLIIVIGIMMTKEKGLSEDTWQLYLQAENMSEKVSSSIWKDFEVSKFPVAIRIGDQEYVIENQIVKKRKPVLEVIACTAYPVEGIYNIFILGKEEMDTLGSFAEGLGEDQYLLNQFGFEREEISRDEYVAILFHEGFHAYQFQNFGSKIEKWYFEVDLFLNENDSDAYEDSYEKESELLYEALMEKDVEKCKTKIREYITLRLLRDKKFENDYYTESYLAYKRWEDYYELIEGSATYISYKVLELRGDEETCKKYYEVLLTNDKIGVRKFYDSGMAICLLLDRLDPSWKELLFKTDISLFELLQDKMEE